ncbi:MAG: fumarate hydratase [Deltaproteobacteria bacterium]|nr:fumarate hydratase [Deltaproteobacteria bacterium]
MQAFEERMVELVERTSSRLPDDAMRALAEGRAREDAATRSAIALQTVAINVDMARRDVAAICQDTGMPTFEIHAPLGFDALEAEACIHRALARATEAGILRRNSVDSLTGENQGNAGTGYPVIHVHTWQEPHVRVRLLLKGGGCENMSTQYSLPAELEGLGRAGRDLDGVRKCVLNALWKAQGKGCSPGFLGVCIGGDRTSSHELAKAQLFRPLNDVNPEPSLARLEAYVLEAGNRLGIGTMGFGGDITVLGCKVGARNRLPACFFVSVAYNCWAFRRQAVHLDAQSFDVLGWDYLDPAAPDVLSTASDEGGFSDGSVRRLRLPISEEEARSLRVGDVVLLDGTLHLGRDRFHAHFLKEDLPVDVRGSAIYHCGPVMLKEGDTWRVMAAGPTTSIREEPYQADILRKTGFRVVIGKGGMGARTLRGLQDVGAVYAVAVGGAAQYYARRVRAVQGVHCLEFGIPEAMWHFEVRDFPVFVTMDSHGQSLHAEVETASLDRLKALADPVF